MTNKVVPALINFTVYWKNSGKKEASKQASADCKQCQEGINNMLEGRIPGMVNRVSMEGLRGG